MSFGSQQLRLFRRARRDGASIEDAAEAAGISIGEARLHAAEDDRNPPPPGAYELLRNPDAPAARVTDQEEDDMARQQRMAREPEDDSEAGEGGGISGEYKRPDAARALEIYRNQIAPKKEHLATIKGDLSDPYTLIKDECHFPRKVLDFLVALQDMEDAKRDHFVLALNLGMKELGITLPRDLVTMAQGDDGGNVIPIGAAARSTLATLGTPQESDGTETDLADAGLFTEAEPGELAKQEGRGRKRKDEPDEAAAD